MRVYWVSSLSASNMTASSICGERHGRCADSQGELCTRGEVGGSHARTCACEINPPVSVSVGNGDQDNLGKGEATMECT